MAIVVLIVLTALFGVIGDILINQWAKTASLWWIALSVPMWALAAVAFGLMLMQKHYSFAVAVIVVVLIHSAIALAWDHFAERAVLTPMQWVGVGAAFVAIILMEAGASN